MSPFVKTWQRHCRELIGGAEYSTSFPDRDTRSLPLSRFASYPSPIPHYPPPLIFFLTHNQSVGQVIYDDDDDDDDDESACVWSSEICSSIK